jgi:hypothetical protein
VLWGNGGLDESPVARLRSRSLRVAPRETLLAELREALGEERVKLVKA